MAVEDFVDKCSVKIEREIKQLVAENPNKVKPIMLESDAVYEQRIRRDFLKNYTTMQIPLVHGASLLNETLHDFHEKDPEGYPTEAIEDFTKISKAMDSLNDPEKQSQLIGEGMTLSEVFNISQESQQVFYKIVHQLMVEKRFEEALDVLAVLLGMNPKKMDGWLDFGYLQYRLERYEEALESYYIASLESENDVRPYLYSVSCYLKLGKNDSARDLVELLSKALETTESDNPWVVQLESLKSQI